MRYPRRGDTILRRMAEHCIPKVKADLRTTQTLLSAREAESVVKGSDLVVTGGSIVTPGRVIQGDVVISEGQITAIGRNLATAGSSAIDATGMFVLPGVIDPHVHMRDPGLTDKEDFETGTTAAAAGGVTTVLEMPNTLPPVDSVDRFLEKKRVLAPKAVVDFGLYAVLHDGNAGAIGDLVKTGAVAFKAFMGPTVGEIPSPSDATIFEAMVVLKQFEVPLAFHCEDRSMVNWYTSKVKGEGRTDAKAHCAARPSICESDAVNRVAYLASQSGGKAHLVHISTAESVRVIRNYRRRGVPISCEVTPHHLILAEDDVDRLGSLSKVNPPIRKSKDREALWGALRSGLVDCIGSDHAPHLVVEKQKKNIWEVPSGFVGVETLLPLMLDRLSRRKISVRRISDLLSRNVARLYGLERKGEIKNGKDGDLVIVDLKTEHIIESRRLHSKQRITPFEGRKVKAAVRYTIVRGNVVYDGETISAAGEWIRPNSLATTAPEDPPR